MLLRNTAAIFIVNGLDCLVVVEDITVGEEKD